MKCWLGGKQFTLHKEYLITEGWSLPLPGNIWKFFFYVLFLKIAIVQEF